MSIRPVGLAKTAFFSTVQLPAASALSKKKVLKNNDEEDERIKFDPKITAHRKSYGRYFEIIIEL